MGEELNVAVVSRIANAIGDSVAGLWDGFDSADLKTGFDLVQAFFGIGQANVELQDLNLAEQELLVDLVGQQVKKSLRTRAALVVQATGA